MAGATAVIFGDITASSFMVDSNLQITAIALAHATDTLDVRVTTPRGTSVQTAGSVYEYSNLSPAMPLPGNSRT